MEQNRTTSRQHDWGHYVYVPVTLRQLEAAGILLDSEMGCDDAEHAEMLDDPSILRACIDLSVEDSPDGDVYERAEIECLGGEGPSWSRATPLPTHLSRGGERGLWNANQQLLDDERKILVLARGDDEAVEVIDRLTGELSAWWKSEYGDKN